MFSKSWKQTSLNSLQRLLDERYSTTWLCSSDGTCSAHLSASWFTSPSPPNLGGGWLSQHCSRPPICSHFVSCAEQEVLCLQLFPALQTKELCRQKKKKKKNTYTQTPTHTLKHNSKHTSPSFVLPLSLCSGCPSQMWRWPPGMTGWGQTHVCFSFQDNIASCA